VITAISPSFGPESSASRVCLRLMDGFDLGIGTSSRCSLSAKSAISDELHRTRVGWQ